MLTSIAIILVALATMGNSVAIFFSERRYQQSKNGFLSDIPISQREARLLNDEIDKIKDEVKYIRPLIDKYKKERKRQHWKQYNDWQVLHVNKNEICAQCHSEDLEINTDYKHETEKYEGWYVREVVDYPLSAEYKCNTCREVISTWKFKEEK